MIAAAVLLGTAVSACAGELDNPPRPCDGNTYEIVQCQIRELAKLNQRLAKAYKKALEMAEPQQLKKLKELQDRWLKFREADCDYYELASGTIARVEGGYCMMDLTRARAKELEVAVEP